MCVYLYVCVHLYMCVPIYVYIHIYYVRITTTLFLKGHEFEGSGRT